MSKGTGVLPAGQDEAISGVRDMFRAEDAERYFKARAGKPYQPSNGSEGELFMDLWCHDCLADQAFRADPVNPDGCPIIAMSMALSASDPDYPPEWRYSASGQPECTAWRPTTPPLASDEGPATPPENEVTQCLVK